MSPGYGQVRFGAGGEGRAEDRLESSLKFRGREVVGKVSSLRLQPASFYPTSSFIRSLAFKPSRGYQHLGFGHRRIQPPNNPHQKARGWPQPTHPIRQQPRAKWMDHRLIGWTRSLAPGRASPASQLGAADSSHLFGRRE